MSQKAIASEIERQIDAIRGGGRVVQETRLWDASARRTVSMRSKEEAHDYRYFPEPDLPPLVVDSARLGGLRLAMPELPAARRQRLQHAYALSDVDVLTLTQVVPGFDAYFEETIGGGADGKAVKNWLLGVVRAKMNDEGIETVAALRDRMPPARLAALLTLVEQGSISGPMAKDVFEKMFATGRTAQEIVSTEGLAQIDDESQIVDLIAAVMAKNEAAVEQYRAGKATTFGFLVGQVMKAAAGKANPKRVNDLLKRALEGVPR